MGPFIGEHGRGWPYRPINEQGVDAVNSLSHELFMKTNVVVVSYSAVCKRIIDSVSCFQYICECNNPLPVEAAETLPSLSHPLPAIDKYLFPACALIVNNSAAQYTQVLCT